MVLLILFNSLFEFIILLVSARQNIHSHYYRRQLKKHSTDKNLCTEPEDLVCILLIIKQLKKNFN